MSQRTRDVLGILGGMGAEAGALLYQRLVRRTEVARDQDHIETVLYSATLVPDRTESVLGVGEPCLPALLEAVHFLDSCGVRRIIIGCVTSHVYVRELRAAVRCEIVSAIEETLREIQISLPDARRVGVLATTGTVRSGLFQEALAASGIVAEVPDDAMQRELVMEAIYGAEGVKAGHEEPGRSKLLEAASELVTRGVDGVIAGCTEIPIVLRQEDCPVPLFDPIDALIDAAIIASGRRVRAAVPTLVP